MCQVSGEFWGRSLREVSLFLVVLGSRSFGGDGWGCRRGNYSGAFYVLCSGLWLT